MHSRAHEGPHMLHRVQGRELHEAGTSNAPHALTRCVRDQVNVNLLFRRRIHEWPFCHDRDRQAQ